MSEKAEPSDQAPREKSADPEGDWLRNVYKRGARQLTVRAVLSGMVIGAVMCLSNLYVVLKTGWSLGVTVTACIIAFAAFSAAGSVRRAAARVLPFIGKPKHEFGMLENNAMGSVASAAGYMTGGGNMAAVPALLVLTGFRPDGWSMFLWFAVIAALGVFAAIPIKRQLINIEELPFPTGRATAETIESMHSLGHHETPAEGAAADEASPDKDSPDKASSDKASLGEASPDKVSPDKAPPAAKAGKAQLLAIFGLVGAVVAFFRDAKAKWIPFNLPSHFAPPVAWGGFAAEKWTMSFDGSLILVGAGALMGFRTGWSMLIGAIATYGFLAPAMVAGGVIAEVKYKVIVQWTLWPGAAILLSSGLVSFAFQWRSIGKSFAGLAQLLQKKAGKTVDPLADIECPAWWFPAGFALFGPIVVYLMHSLFQIPYWAGFVALPLSVIMGVVAARVTGETDVTPTKALGPVTQLAYGGMVPGNIAANVMGANVTGGVGLHAADLLTDLKSGYLLGANPRQQFYAQLFGVVAGAAAIVPAFNLLVPDASVIGGEQFPAPAVQVWAGVSRALTDGIGGLHSTAKTAALVGFAIGTVLALAEKFTPKKYKPYVPSASGLGIALVIPGANSIAMFLGALIAEVLRRRRPDLAERTVVPVSSGLIAGESLMGIAVAVLIAFGVLQK
jgi:OPT family oligopeptide transporter